MKREHADMFELQDACDFAICRIVDQGGQCRENDRITYGDSSGRHSPAGWFMNEYNPMLMKAEGTLDMMIEEFELGEFLPCILKDNIEAFNLLEEFHSADKKETRQECLNRITSFGITTSELHWSKWVNLGN